jgi:competence protein ComEC
MYAAIAAGIWSANRPTAEPEARPHFHLPAVGSTTTRLWVGGAGVIALLAWLAVLALPDGRLHVAFLDVGQGDAILVTTPDGRQLLIDGGPAPTDLNWRLGQEMPFWDRTLEMVVNTHPDSDHLGGLVSLLDRYQVQQAVVSDLAISSQLYLEWEQELAEANLTPVVGQAGQQLELGGGVIATVLNPGPASAGLDDPNDHWSCCVCNSVKSAFCCRVISKSPLNRSSLPATCPWPPRSSKVLITAAGPPLVKPFWRPSSRR